MVLPDRIELSTSPLPMECSTTELRQHARYQGIGLKGPHRRPVLATRATLVQARGRGGKGPKSPKIGAGCFDGGNSGPIRFPSPLPDLEMRGIGVQASDATRPALLLPWAVHRCHRLIILRYHGYWVRHEGRSRQGHEKDRRGHEGFTTRPAEAGVARKSQAAEVAGPRARRCERIFRKCRRLTR
jgi:hypothetical protein